MRLAFSHCEWMIFRKAKTDRWVSNSSKYFQSSLDLFFCFKLFKYLFYCYRTVAPQIDTNQKLTNLFTSLYIQDFLYLNIKPFKSTNSPTFLYLEPIVSQAAKIQLIFKQNMPSPLLEFVTEIDPSFSVQSASIKHFF